MLCSATISEFAGGLKNASIKSAKWHCDKAARKQEGELFPGACFLLVDTGRRRFSGHRESVVVPGRPRLCRHESCATPCRESQLGDVGDRKSTRLNSSHSQI